MVRSRILWICWLSGLAVFWFVTGEQTGIVLLLLSVLLPLLAAVPFAKVPKKLEVRLQSESAGIKGSEAACSVFLKNSSLMSVNRAMVRVRVDNLLTGEKTYAAVRMAVPAKGEMSTFLQLSSRYAGRVRIRAVRVTVYDLFGLFQFRAAVNGKEEAKCLFRPETFGMEAELSYGENASLDSDVYSMRKPGFDPSETFAIREYRAGDRIRQIHWKLSEKYDDLMVRDYGLPIQNSVLLALETGRMPGSNAPDPACMDALAEAMVSLSQTLIEQQVMHCIGWQNHEENVFSCVEIESDEDLAGSLTGLLSAVPGEDSMHVLEHYLEEHEQLAFAHVVLFTTEHRKEFGALAGQCVCTEVICGNAGNDYTTEDGITVIRTTPETIAEAMVYVEI
ncbi:MAG: DUF58 domain-containing protein [Eubacteriales bacterium]|nr:DUF58 domain-containing protein [Eubacteriales bacterium]